MLRTEPRLSPKRLQDSGQNPNPDRGVRREAKRELGGRTGVGELGKPTGGWGGGDRRTESLREGKLGCPEPGGRARSSPRRPGLETAELGGWGWAEAGTQRAAPGGKDASWVWR